jgi:gliding motility-associated-like protein
MKYLLLPVFLCLFIITSYSQVNCNNWLRLVSKPAYADLGDLDIPGNIVTVEAMINRTAPYSGAQVYAGDVVSKHLDPTNANYLLRPNTAEITTTNGYFKTPDICDIELNKTYHVALVYDGITLKFYRDGFLMSQVAASGNLFQNNFPTRIGDYTGGSLPENFIGYINEVRIWNVVRSQAEIRTYMNASLPNPASQPGLQAYYTFDNLINKQGNTTWNATLTGSASMNATNSSCTFTPDSCKIAIAQFTTPDTVCVNTPVTITNTSSGASTYYWNFCVADINTPPAAQNIGNPGGLLNGPVFMDYAYVNGNYYGFVVNHYQAGLIRLDYGNSLLNTPIPVNLGNYGGLLQNSGSEGIQVVQNEGKWYAIIVGGSPVSSTQPRLIKIDFGANIASAGTPTNWGNIGNMNQPIELHVFKEGNNWYGFTVNAEANTITRFNFTNSFDNTPTAVNLGNVGQLKYPTGIYAINDNGFWRVFIVNGGDNGQQGIGSSLTRLDFGSSLLNTPTGINLGNPGNALQHPRDFTLMKFCGQIIGFAVNGNPAYNDIVRLNFSNDLTLAPTATSLGNLGNLNFPHSISKLFRANDEVYAFITNVSNNTITRLRFQGCTNASVSSSVLQDPQPVTYSTPGTYNINLTIDDGLPTQTSYCKQVVVMDPPTHTPTKAINICTGDMVKIGTGVKFAQYTWNTGDKTDSITVSTAGTYWVQTDKYGCSNRDTSIVTLLPNPVVDLGPDKLLCTVSNMVLDAGNASVGFLWQDGSSNQTFTANSFGKYYVRVTSASGCVNSDTIFITNALTIPADFQFKQDVCNPLSVQFTGIGTGLLNPYWSFGDGNTASGNFTVTHTYPGDGNYTVKLGIESGACKDTITKIILIQVTNANLIVTPDTTICFNTTKQLRTQPALSFCWSPISFLNNPNVANPITSTPGKMTYYYTAEVTGNNLVLNGDFNNGTADFTSTYTWSTSGVPVGVYFVGNNPNTWHPAMPACKDHTTGTGNMLLVNGATTPNVPVWKETITVTPNTNYAFSAWLQHITTINPARLQFSINGNMIGNVFQANSTSCIWDQFYTIWNSGNNTKADISVVNQNTVLSGNDFALDDISFAPVFIQRDSVIISVDTPVVQANRDTTICKDGQVQLQATGAATWIWSPVAGLTNTTIPNPVASPAINTDYIVTGTTINGCTAKDTVVVTLYPVPTIITEHDTTICPNTSVQLAANNTMTTYAWTPAATLNNPAIANPVASPGKSTVYKVQVTDGFKCSYTDSVNVQVRTFKFAAGLNSVICQGASIGLQAIGGDRYQWSPAGSLDNGNIATPIATPDTTTFYHVTIGESNCGTDTTFNVRIIVKPTPVVKAEKVNDIDCLTHSTKLNVTGSTGSSYLWTPTKWLDYPTLPDPVSSTDTTTTYFVTGTNKHGCSALDSVTVYVTTTKKVSFEVPNAFTPNGDGINDCLGLQRWGGANIEEFSIFNRWGERVFTTNKPVTCWDGRFRGEAQPAGGYTYIIKAKTFCGTIKRSGVVMLIR